jgi:hypothetical protein
MDQKVLKSLKSAYRSDFAFQGLCDVLVALIRAVKRDKTLDEPLPAFMSAIFEIRKQVAAEKAARQAHGPRF